MVSYSTHRKLIIEDDIVDCIWKTNKGTLKFAVYNCIDHISSIWYISADGWIYSLKLYNINMIWVILSTAYILIAYSENLLATCDFQQ